MTPSRPYLLDAFYRWIIDNNCTPYVVVDAEYPDVNVPTQFVEDGRIVLNIAPVAVQAFELNNSLLQFSGRFSGSVRYVSVPIKAVLAIYARENGRGMVFTEEDAEGDEAPPPKHSPDSNKKKAVSHLKVVK